ncbi:hypothetical protein MH138_11995 [Bacillus safensis]|nr:MULTISPECIES: hypothetical protein [Bacillus]MCM3140247.1 hypothetical protein [Bacillus safensis]MCY7583973.1 hypothetical protein [Bacillus safensis]MCY7588279.1 hypothetical protein [Bacillus safensis]MCY7609096.1 hypothetical protein [Bacillus safensis]UXC32949.1 hypothetical protein N4Q31_02285 [Bacillus safensis]
MAATAGIMSSKMDRFAELDEAVHATENEINAISTLISQTIVETNAMVKELNTLMEQNDRMFLKKTERRSKKSLHPQMNK